MPSNPRRLLLQALATGVTRAPKYWLPPVVAVVTLPAHAQTSETCNADGQVVLGSCSGFVSCTDEVRFVGETPSDCEPGGNINTNINSLRCLEQRFRVVGSIDGTTLDVEVVATQQSPGSSGALTEEPILSEQEILQAALGSGCGSLSGTDAVLSGGGTPELIDECGDGAIVDLSEGDVIGDTFETLIAICGTVTVTLNIFQYYRSEFTLTVDG